MGAAFLEEVLANLVGLADALELTGDERVRLLQTRAPPHGRGPTAAASSSVTAPATAVAHPEPPAVVACPRCEQRRPLLADVNVAAQHEGWGLRWNQCAYACWHCRRSIPDSLKVTCCSQCRIFWHGDCGQAQAAEEALVQQRLEVQNFDWGSFEKVRALNQIDRPRLPVPRFRKVPGGKQASNKLSLPGGRLQPRGVPRVFEAARKELRRTSCASSLAIPSDLRASVGLLALPTQRLPLALTRSPPGVLLQRTVTCPVTSDECQLAAERAATALVPLRAWRKSSLFAAISKRARPSLAYPATSRDLEELPLSAHEKLVEDTEPLPGKFVIGSSGTSHRHTRVQDQLLRRRVPNKRELENPFKAEAAAHNAEPEGERRRRNFEEIRSHFKQEFGDEVQARVQHAFNSSVKMEPAPVSRQLKEKFERSCCELSGSLIATYHGSNSENYASICEKGLLIPGRGNDLEIVHGRAHGRGIYTASVDAPWLSMCFSTEKRLLVCGVLDDSENRFLERHVIRGLEVKGKSAAILHVGDAVVVFDDRRVVPLFMVTQGPGGKRAAQAAFARAPMKPPATKPGAARFSRIETGAFFPAANILPKACALKYSFPSGNQSASLRKPLV